MSTPPRRLRAVLARNVAVGAIAVLATVLWSRHGARPSVVAAPAPRGMARSASGVHALSARDVLASPDPDRGDSIRFVEHPDVYPVGWPSNAIPLALANPFERNAKALETGARLYVSYNCIDCHGAEGSGSMGPSLADGRWHFGGSAAEVFESIFQGRPDGMPAWGGRISNDQIWMLVSYVRSLNGGRDVSTRNFTARTGRTVERSGH